MDLKSSKQLKSLLGPFKPSHKTQRWEDTNFLES